MALRPGSKEAIHLFNNCSDEKVWRDFFDNYRNAVIAVAKGKKKIELIEWDSFLWQKLPELVKSREPHHLILAEVAEVMKWKLSRGKARPLQKLVESNSEGAVLKASAASFHLLSKHNWEGAINEITVLKGVGVATATAILAPFSPSDIPFMADEVMEAVSCHRDYTMKIYKEMRLRLVQKAKDLQELSSFQWTAENVGKALWTCAMTAAYPAISFDASAPPAKQTTDKHAALMKKESLLLKRTNQDLKQKEDCTDANAGADDDLERFSKRVKRG